MGRYRNLETTALAARQRPPLARENIIPNRERGATLVKEEESSVMKGSQFVKNVNIWALNALTQPSL